MKDKVVHTYVLIFVTRYTVTPKMKNYHCSLILFYLHMYNKLKIENFWFVEKSEIFEYFFGGKIILTKKNTDF